jgi:hypothetical protein
MAIVIKGGEIGQDVYYAGSLNGRPVWSMGTRKIRTRTS